MSPADYGEEMHSDGQAILTWIACALCVVLAFACPVVALRLTRQPDRLREFWYISRPGTWVAVCIAGIAFLALSGTVFTVIALRYPDLWAVVVVHLGGLCAVMIFLAAFIDFKKRMLEEQLEKMRPPPNSERDAHGPR